MIDISIQNVVKAFEEGNDILKGVTFDIYEGEHIGLLGKNGAGKTTLFRIITGALAPDEGEVILPAGKKIGLISQIPVFPEQYTTEDVLRTAFSQLYALEEKLGRLARQMEQDPSDALLSEYDALAERFRTLGGYDTDYEINAVANGLEIPETQRRQLFSTLSGGEKTRVNLARLILEKTDILLLDEPTNHLDIESIQWLEQYLANQAKAVVLVSHDRAFINNVSNRTMEISCGQITDYKVKYDEYVVLRKERREQQLRAYENQQKEMAEMKDFIERFRYKATKAVQVQQKVKQLEKIVPIEVDQVDNSAMHLKFPPCLRSGDYPVICEDVKKEYAHVVFEGVNLTIKRGEKVAFVGKNGEGKSTLVKCIMGEIPFDGNLKIGHNVQIGYFAQNQAQLLDEGLTVFQTIDYVAKGEVRLKINDILGAFMFGGEASDKKVKVLSGGERSRLAMIRLLLEPVNLLILDEPTNHLDMASKDVLKEAIKAFDGTAIIVSHDREFLDGLVTKVYEFGGGRVREHLGGIYDFLRAKQISELSELQVAKSASSPSTASSPSMTSTTSRTSRTSEASSSSNGAQSYAERKEQQKRVRKAEKAVEESERKISDMERRLKELDELLMKPENASDMKLVTEYTSTKKALDEEVERWERLSEELDTLNFEH